MTKTKILNNPYHNSKIIIRNSHPSFRSPISWNEICTLITKVIRAEDCEIAHLDVNFLTDKDIKSINNKYLKHGSSTDVITFPYEAAKKKIDGELLISLDSVKKNAKIFGTGYKNEFKRVLIHGCLHLAGYKDNSKKSMELIRIKENSYLGI